MKIKNTSKLVLTASLIAFAFAAPVRADDADKAAKKAAHEKEQLEKYDKNHDGKLDDAEKAVQKADHDKAKAEKHGEHEKK